MAFPNWLAKIDGKVNTFVVDPDGFYTALLADLGVTKGRITQYWLEVAFGCMKLDFDLAVRQEKAIDVGRTVTRLVRSDEGRKQRWNLTMFPVGSMEWTKLSMMERSREIRKHYVRIRGYVPTI
jgi:hypothetical protein